MEGRLNAKSFVVCVPMNVDAFVLNRPVCDTGLSRIAPVTQPDYRGLRPEKTEIRADLLPHVDVASSQPASTNSRITATETTSPAHLDPTRPESDSQAGPVLRENRIGIYLHWSLPRLYRAATGGADDVPAAPPDKELVGNENRTTRPTFRPVPNRWYVLRNIQSSVPPAPLAEQRKAWVIESDRLWNVDELSPDVDLETDVSPYVSYKPADEHSPDILNSQAGVYIGAKIPAAAWSEKGNAVPRVPLTVMNSSNFCFADNTMHNPNVFSMVDNFQYVSANGTMVYPEKVVCDYVVLGWHASPDDDPMGAVTGVHGAFKDRLHALFLNAINEEGGDEPASTVCHGTIYNVVFERNTKPPTPADQFGKLFTSGIKMEPVSVGATGLDAVLTFLRAHENNEADVFGPGTTSVASEVLSLSQLLYATEDDYDSRTKASDLIYAHNFTPSEGGRAWHYDGRAIAGGAPARPSSTAPAEGGPSEVDFLRTVNGLQYQLDTAKRKLKYKKWSLFAVWWSFVSDVKNSDPTRKSFYRALADNYRSEAAALTKLISEPSAGLEDQIEVIVRQKRDGGPFFKPRVEARSIPQPTFFQRRDPTICIAGIESGWPTAYMGYVPVRFSFEILNPNAGKLFPADISEPNVTRALWALRQESLATQDHDGLLGFKQWSGQPWCPLYVEWEATYYHIPMDKWSVDMLNSPIDNNNLQVRYGIKELLSIHPENSADQRTVGGRAILLPQTAVNLQAVVAQVLNDPNVDLTLAQITDLQTNISNLKYISAELSGLTTNLLTLADGAHVQPNITVPGSETSFPLAAALASGTEVGFIEEDFVLIGEESALTPYGSLVDFSTALTQPFKGVTHGQMHFTKLNIVDKFGQVVSAIPPLQALDPLKDTIYPCLSDQVCPGLIKDTKILNTVTSLTEVDPQLPGDYPLCQYIQLTPAINQGVRINAEYVVPTLDSAGAFTGWRSTDDWEQPVFAWVIINYADFGLQFFTGDGTFYIEMTFGGPKNTIKSPSWQPFDPPSQSSTLVSPQLEQLIQKMTDPRTGSTYLHSFWEMITAAVETMPFAPAEYAAYSTSIVGKPFALVNAGFSLELALPPLESQITPPKQLNTDASPAADILFGYKFPVKIGDKDRPYDGVVGYFDSDNTTKGSTNWDMLHSYFTADGISKPGDPRLQILPENFDTLSPYYIEPEGPLKNGSFVESHATKFMIKTLLIDPYTPLHLYSPILLIKSLKLPAWTVQTAFQKMSAFFHLGPILITKDVPTTYNTLLSVAVDTWAQKQQQHTAVSPDAAQINLPIGGAKKQIWSWLQPYPPPDNSTGRRYNELDVGEEDGRLRLDPSPYTMVEGFLQLIQPLKQE